MRRVTSSLVCMWRRFYCSSPKSSETKLLRQLRTKIRMTGPITIAEYMRETLTNPVAGYYTCKEKIFGAQGDFVTSPEISQLFGELVAIWCIFEWMKLGSPRPFQLVELGPGRGTLSHDMIRVFKKFNLDQSISLRLVEVGPHLQEVQKECLAGTNVPVSWHRSIADVPRDAFTFYVAHEFFDALPVHKFQRTTNGWREVLVDIDEGSGPHHLRFVLSRSPTPASHVFLDPAETRNSLEVSPEAALIIKEMSTRIEEDGGFALIVDYGHDGTKTDTLRAFSKHKLHDPLCEPGIADLTADVDFAYLQKMAREKSCTFGPVDQGDFLKRLGIETRLQKLLESCKEEKQRQELMSGYQMLVDPGQMGQRFKFFAMFPKVVQEFLQRHAVAGFN